MSWTDEKVEKLKELWAEGLSASEIASRVGGVTRNAVIGKVHRLGLSGRVTTTRQKYRRRKVSRAGGSPSTPRREQGTGLDTSGLSPIVRKNERANNAPIWQQDDHEEIRAFSQKDELVIPIGERKTILTLTATTCRWPIGDPQDEDFHFCGKHCHPEDTYCDFHESKARSGEPLKRLSAPRDYSVRRA